VFSGHRRAVRQHQILQGLDGAHRTECVGYHHTNEFVRRNVGDRFAIVVLDVRIDE